MSGIPTAEDQATLTPADVLDRLRAGHRRFADGTPTTRDLLAQSRASAQGQFPLAAVLGCIDSRVPVEAIFDADIGELFVARSAGNVVDDDVLGGFEFATQLAGTKVIVVLGHSACGAVKGACDGAELGNLTQLLAKITPAVASCASPGESPGSGDATFVQKVVDANVANAVAALRNRSAVLAARQDAGDLVIVGATYDIASATVTWHAAN